MPLLSVLREKMKRMNRRVCVAMACYGVLIAIALYGLLPIRTKEEKYILGLVLFIFALLISKTLFHAKDEKME